MNAPLDNFKSTNSHLSRASYLEDCARRRVLFFTGKGGVGKSTLAWATALACTRRGMRVALASWNPFEMEKPLPIGEEGIQWIALETMSAFREYVLRILKFEKVYNAAFENHVFKTFIRVAPGLPETVIAGKIWDLYERREHDLIIVDLPASGHAITFFQSPLGIQKVFSMGFVHKETEKICSLFQSADSRIDLITLPEELPLTESIQLKEQLETIFPFHFGFIHLNQCLPNFLRPADDSLRQLPSSAQHAWQHYEARHKLELSARGLIPRLNLPVVEIPRLTTETTEDTLESVAQVLETA